jgi:hypothetical protein
LKNFICECPSDKGLDTVNLRCIYPFYIESVEFFQFQDQFDILIEIKFNKHFDKKVELEIGRDIKIDIYSR